MKFTVLHKSNRQKGMALILAIGFLAVLSILGAVVMKVSTEGLSASVETLPKQSALYAADRSIEYSMNRDLIVHLAVAGTVVLADEDPLVPGDVVRQANGANVPGFTHDIVINRTGTGTIVSGTVTDVGPRALPPHMASMHGSEFGANLYHVNVKTQEATAKEPATTHVDASIVRLFKMDDDQIFRTSGGG